MPTETTKRRFIVKHDALAGRFGIWDEREEQFVGRRFLHEPDARSYINNLYLNRREEIVAFILTGVVG